MQKDISEGFFLMRFGLHLYGKKWYSTQYDIGKQNSHPVIVIQMMTTYDDNIRMYYSTICWLERFGMDLIGNQWDRNVKMNLNL